jgi:hypothetical protein
MVPKRYVSTKREVERTLETEFASMRSVSFRPGLLYDASRPITMPLAAATHASSLINGIFGGRLTPLMGAGGFKPLAADEVAEAVVEAVTDDSVKGVIDVKGIEQLAQRAWRKGMV